MFEKIIVKIGTSLEKARIPYIIIGGQAVLLYGEPRLTRDIDVTLGTDIERLSEIINIVKQINIIPIPKDTESFVKETYVLPARDKKSGIRIDFIFSYTPYERQAIKRANKIKIKNAYVNFASLEDIIIHKVFAGRARDIEDIKSIILKNPDFDEKYIKKWLKELDTEGKGFLNCFNETIKEVK